MSKNDLIRESEDLLTKRNSLNNTIGVLENKNDEVKKEIDKLIAELNELGVDIKLDKIEEIYNQEYNKVKIQAQELEEKIRQVESCIHERVYNKI